MRRGDEVGFLGTFKRLQSAQVHLPVIVALEIDHFDCVNGISVFPAFNSIDRRPSICQVLTESFDKLEEGRPYTHDICGLSIYLVDSCDMPSIHELAKNMTTRFPELIWLTFCFENRCEIVSFRVLLTIDQIRS
jgi:hypothetical protein